MEQSSPGKANLSLKTTSSSISAAADKKISVDIVVDATRQSVDGVDAFLQFDTKYLEVVSLTPGKLMKEILTKDYNNSTGMISLSCGNSIPVNVSFVLGTVVFKVKAPITDTSIIFEHKPARNTDAVYGGCSVLGSASNINLPFKK
jgi:hypothetical protein